MVGALTLRTSHAHRRLIRRYRFVPKSQRKEDVRGHVLGVRGRGCDLGVKPGRSETERGVHWVVIGMKQIMQGSGVALFDLVYSLGFRRCPHVDPEVARR